MLLKRGKEKNGGTTDRYRLLADRGMIKLKAGVGACHCHLWRQPVSATSAVTAAVALSPVNPLSVRVFEFGPPRKDGLNLETLKGRSLPGLSGPQDPPPNIFIWTPDSMLGGPILVSDSVLTQRRRGKWSQQVNFKFHRRFWWGMQSRVSRHLPEALGKIWGPLCVDMASLER